jgi:N-acetylneuraminate synthase
MNLKEIRLDGRVYEHGRPLVIAEISCNHAGDRNIAMKLVDAAARAGADAVKFQLYAPKDMTLPVTSSAFAIDGEKWGGMTNLWDLYAQAHTPYAWAEDLSKRARDQGLAPIFSVFSERGIELAERYGAAITIASADADWTAFVLLAAGANRPLFISDGVVGDRWDRVVEATRGVPLVRMRCVSDYPASAESYGFGDLVRVPIVRPWGLSLHARKYETLPAVATALGAVAIEAHIMLHPEAYGAAWSRVFDKDFSLMPSEFSNLVAHIRSAQRACRPIRRTGTDITAFRRRWVAARNIPADKILEPEDVVALRCGSGIPTCQRVAGAYVAVDIAKGQPIHSGMIV